jgi:hypothetical protein
MTDNIYIDNVRDDDHVELTENGRAYVVVRDGERLLVSWQSRFSRASQRRLNRLVRATKERSG